MGEGAGPVTGQAGQEGDPTSGRQTDLGPRVVVRRVAPGGTSGATPETEEIQQEIERTRSEMGETIDAIQERLAPEHLTEQAKDTAHELTEQAIAQAKEAVREVARDAQEAVRAATIGKVEQMAYRTRAKAEDVRSSVFDTIRENPIPAAMVGLGLGWLFMNGSRSSSRRDYRDYSDLDYAEFADEYDGGYEGYQGSEGLRRGGAVRGPRRSAGYAGAYGYGAPTGRSGVREEGVSAYGAAGYAGGRGGESGESGGVRERVTDAASGAVDRVAGAAGSVADRASDVAGQAADTAQGAAGWVADTAVDLADAAQYRASRLEDRFQSALYTNPLAVGAAAVGVGALIGLVLPRTRSEDELMGEARDRVMGQVGEVVDEAKGKVEQVAGEAQRAASDAARDQGLLDSQGGGSGGSGGFGTSSRP